MSYPNTQSQNLLEQVVSPLFAGKEGVGNTPVALLRLRRKRAQERLRDALLLLPGKPLLDTELQELVTAWAAVDFADDFPAILALELRCANEAEAGLQGAMERYRQHLHERYGWLELKGLQTAERVLQPLHVAYVALHVEEPDESFKIPGLKNRFPASALLNTQSPPRILIRGAPGGGKTTLISWLVLQLLDRPEGFPLIVPIRSLQGPLDLPEIARLNLLELDLLIEKLPTAVLFVDGLDEGKDPLQLLAAAQELIARYPSLGLVITSRPVTLERVSVPGFRDVTLSPLTTDEIESFVQRWCLSAEQALLKDQLRAQELATIAAKDLIARVQSSRPVRDLMATPLLCSVACVVHRFLGQRIPEKRSALYEACSNVLLYEWDRARLPGSVVGSLDADQKRVLLGGLALWMLQERHAEVSAEVVQRIFAERLPLVGERSEKAEVILQEIKERSGILVERSPGFYAFSHLGFQEYMAARELVRQQAYKMILDHCEDDAWQEVIVLAAGIPGVQAGKLIQGLLKKKQGERLGKPLVLAWHCVQSAVEVPVAVRKAVEDRIKRWVPPRNPDDVSWLVTLGPMIGEPLRPFLKDKRPEVRGYTADAILWSGNDELMQAMEHLLQDSEIFKFSNSDKTKISVQDSLSSTILMLGYKYNIKHIMDFINQNRHIYSSLQELEPVIKQYLASSPSTPSSNNS